MTSTKRQEREEEDDWMIRIINRIIFTFILFLFIIMFVVLPISIVLSIIHDAISGPVEYTVAIRDPSPEVNWHGWATVWCAHKNECRGI